MSLIPRHSRRAAVLLALGAPACGAGADGSASAYDAPAGDGQSDSRTQQGGADKINGGVRDDTHRDVVVIHVQLGSGTASCSGSLIAPNLVLTARHCVSELNSESVICEGGSSGGGLPSLSGSNSSSTTTPNAPLDASNFKVSTATDLASDTPYVGVAAVEVPDGTTGQSICGHDIALLRLAAPLREAGLIEPRVDVAPSVGETYTAVGYGITDVSRRDANQRRMREGLTVRTVGEQRASNQLVQTSAEWSGNTGTCPGDSGGPAIDTAGATFGILSRGDSQSCDSPVYTRVDAFGSWLRERATAAAQALGEAPPAWVAGPTPGTTGANRTGVPPAANGSTDTSTGGDGGAGGLGIPLPGAGCSVRGPGGAGNALTALGALGLALGVGRATRRRRRSYPLG